MDFVRSCIRKAITAYRIGSLNVQPTFSQKFLQLDHSICSTHSLDYNIYLYRKGEGGGQMTPIIKACPHQVWKASGAPHPIRKIQKYAVSTFIWRDERFIFELILCACVIHTAIKRTLKDCIQQSSYRYSETVTTFEKTSLFHLTSLIK